MKGLLWVLLSVAGTAMVFLSFSGDGGFSDVALTHHGNGVVEMTTNRKLKDNGHTSSTKKNEAGSVNLEDYHPTDPVPSSKASIRPGPIQHGTPLMPFIPKPSPPHNPATIGLP